jgi:hypothetical protein
LWGDVLYLIPVRDPGAIAASLDHRDSLSRRGSFLLWHRYMKELIEDNDVKSTGLFLNYEQLVANPHTQCRSLCTVLDQRLGTSPPNPDHRVDLMAAVVEPGLQRSIDHGAFAENPLATEAEKRLYYVLLEHANGDRQPVHSELGLQPQWREALLLEDLFHRSGISRARCQVFGRTAQDGYSEDQSHSVAVRMDGTPQHVEIPIPLSRRAGTVSIRIDLADRPASIWITSLEIVDSAQHIVWTMDSEPDLLPSLHKHKIGLCQRLRGEKGCFLRLDSYDSWIELVLTPSQSAAIEGGAVLDFQCTYASSLEHMLLSDQQEYTRRLTVLESKQAELQCAFESSPARRLRKRMAAIVPSLSSILGSVLHRFMRPRNSSVPRGEPGCSE